MFGIQDSSTIVSVPAKCGWQSLYAVLISKTDSATNILPNHGDDQHLEEFNRRVLIIRDPLDRVISQYYFTKHNRSRWKRISEHFKTFYNFSKFICTEERNRSVMFKPLHEYTNNFDPHLLLKQEDIEERWEEVFPKEVLPIYQKTSKHKTPIRKPIEETIKKVHPDFIDYLKVEYKALKGHYKISKYQKILGI